MGLKCSQWLEARVYFRYDARTKQFVDERPRAARPVSEDVDAKMAWVSWYLGGHLAARIMLDSQLANVAGAVDVMVERASADDAPREMVAIDNLCRNGLRMEQRDYDVADLIDLRAQAAVAVRAHEITTMLEHAMEAGRRLGARSR